MAKKKDDKKNISQKPKKKRSAASTQKHLDIAEIREDAIIMNDGTLRSILLVSSINFALKSEDEQNAIIASYVNFLNTIDFPLEIVIQSRKLDIDAYIDKLKLIQREQKNELLKMQTVEYTQYVRELIEIGNIMTKRFYVVIPYNPMSDKQKNFFKRFLELFRAARTVRLGQKRFQQRKKELDQRVDHVVNAFSSIGLKSVKLDTQGVIELMYNTYNPGVSERQKLTDLSKLQIEG